MKRFIIPVNNAFANVCLVSPLIFLNFISIAFTEAQEYRQLRERMVKDQIIARGIKSKEVIAAMRKVERHLFVPKEYTERAYADNAQPIGEGQTISQPYIVAYMTEALELKPTSTVLEVGTGSGYQAAILGEICDHVYTIEIVPILAKRSTELLKSLGYENISVREGDGYAGWPDKAPFDAIIVTCSPTHVPQPLQDQLKEGGRIIIPVGERYTQELVLLEKRKGELTKLKTLPVVFVPMKDEKGKRY